MMMELSVEKLHHHDDCELFLPTDSNGREIFHYYFKDAVLVGDNLVYPNLRLYSHLSKRVFNPLEEKVMSLSSLSERQALQFDESFDSVNDNPVFFFCYNTDNYFHFLYDSLPILHGFFDLKRRIPSLKLLMCSPNFDKKDQYKFVSETLQILGVRESDIEKASDKTLYRSLYVSSSYTHGIDSNLPPRKELHDFLKRIPGSTAADLPRKIYISRRSWVHGDYSNIGTDYTSRRKMMNEDRLIETLKKREISEVFTETITTLEKIQLFKNAETVVGSIGGGMANSLFSPSSVRTAVIVSPTFLEVNERFKHCFSGVDVMFATKSRHISADPLKKFMRVSTCDSRVGEIYEIEGNFVTVSCAKNRVAGWNNSLTYEKHIYTRSQLTALDQGLNSEWECDIDEVLECLK